MITVFVPLITFVIKILLYQTALKLRKLEALWITASMCAGASVLVGWIPFPPFILFILIIGVAGFFIVKNSGADIFPDALGIPLVVEIISAFLLSYAVIPLLELILQ